MLFEDKETQRIVEKIKEGALAFTSAELLHALATAKKSKPHDLDKVSSEAQELYRGCSGPLLAAELARRFSATIQGEFSLDALPIMRMLARMDSGVYARPADRWLERDGERLESDDEAAKLFAWALRKARFHARMQECERRTLIPPKWLVGEIVWLPGLNIPKIRLYWPHQVNIMCHPQASTVWGYKWLVMLAQAKPSPSAEGNWFKVYSRDPPEELSGTFGDWFVSSISDQGEQAQKTAAPVKYAGSIAPLFLIQLDDTESDVNTVQDADTVNTVLNLGVMRADEGLVLTRQGHSQMWTDDVSELAVLAVGPDKVLRVGNGKKIEVLSYAPALADAREARRMRMRELAIARGNSPHAYDDMGSVPPSGVAKKSDQTKHDDLVAENADIFEVVEEEEPLAVLVDVVRTFHKDGRRLLDGVLPRCQTKRVQIIEDPSQRQDRLLKAKGEGIISKARVGVEAEYYDTEDDALEAFKKIDEAALAPAPPPAPPAHGDLSKKTTQNGGPDGAGQAGPTNGNDPGGPGGAGA